MKTLPKKFKDAIKITVEKDILPSLGQNIGDYVAHYMEKSGVDLENEKAYLKVEKLIVDQIWKEILKKVQK